VATRVADVLRRRNSATAGRRKHARALSASELLSRQNTTAGLYPGADDDDDDDDDDADADDDDADDDDDDDGDDDDGDDDVDEEAAEVDEAIALTRTDAHTRLTHLVDSSVQFHLQPVLNQAALDELFHARGELGRNPTKARGVGQSALMVQWGQRQSALGAHMRALDAAVTALGTIVNKFMALNSGQLIESMWHTDVPLDILVPPTHRVVFNYNDGKGAVGINFRSRALPDVVVVKHTPVGYASVVSCAVATNPTLEHSHSGSGSPNLSFIYDIVLLSEAAPSAVVSGQPAAPACAAPASLDWTTLKFAIEDFKGPWRKWGLGGGSTRRNALAAVHGPVGFRLCSKKDALERVQAMTPADLQAAAASNIHRQWFVAGKPVTAKQARAAKKEGNTVPLLYSLWSPTK
jgi:hypothetical protein